MLKVGPTIDVVEGSGKEMLLLVALIDRVALVVFNECVHARKDLLANQKLAVLHVHLEIAVLGARVHCDGQIARLNREAIQIRISDVRSLCIGAARVLANVFWAMDGQWAGVVRGCPQTAGLG